MLSIGLASAVKAYAGNCWEAAQLLPVLIAYCNERDQLKTPPTFGPLMGQAGTTREHTNLDQLQGSRHLKHAPQVPGPIC